MSDIRKPRQTASPGQDLDAGFDAFLRENDSRIKTLYRKLPHPEPDTELDSRVRALARRAEPSLAEVAPEFCGLRVDAEQGAVYRGGQPMELPPRELALLRALLDRPGRALAKERLLELVFPDDAAVQAEAIEVVAYRLRKRLLGTGAQLVTLRGLGYLLQAEP